MIDAPYPSDTRAKGWRFEVDTEVVRASDTWLRAKTGPLKGALLLLWAEAWQQTPCGSLPDDDELVALMIDMPAPTFERHRAVLMRGWAKAGDGRLYHDTITKRVLAMLAKRAKDAGRAAERRGRIAESNVSHTEVTRDKPVTPPLSTREFDTKHQAPSTSNQKPEKKKEKGADALTVDFLIADGLTEQTAAEWLAHRKRKGSPLMGRAWEGIKAEAAKAAMTNEEAVCKAMERGWAGFEAAWLADRAGPVGKQAALEARNAAVLKDIFEGAR